MVEVSNLNSSMLAQKSERNKVRDQFNNTVAAGAGIYGTRKFKSALYRRSDSLTPYLHPGEKLLSKSLKSKLDPIVKFFEKVGEKVFSGKTRLGRMVEDCIAQNNSLLKGQTLAKYTKKCKGNIAMTIASGATILTIAGIAVRNAIKIGKE